MSEIVFNPEEESYRPGGYHTRAGLIGCFMKLTGITSEAAANQILLVVAIVFFILALAIFIIYT